MTAVCLTDRMPRRKVLIIGTFVCACTLTFVCACTLAINAGLSAVLDNQVKGGGAVSKKVGQGALAAYFLFNIIFSFTYTPLQGEYISVCNATLLTGIAVVPTESLENTTRAKGLAASGVIVNAFGFINSFAGPYALGNIGLVLMPRTISFDADG